MDLNVLFITGSVIVIIVCIVEIFEDYFGSPPPPVYIKHNPKPKSNECSYCGRGMAWDSNCNNCGATWSDQ